jgi:hypothetical protein
MIERVVQYFKGNGENPCSPESAVSVMQMMDSFVAKENYSDD